MTWRLSITMADSLGLPTCACGLAHNLPSPVSPSVGDTGEGVPGWPDCGCGAGAILTYAWTVKNAGRRFYGCRNYGNPRFCGFHAWHDPPTPDYLKESLLGVRCDGRYAWKKVVEAEAEVERLKKVAEAETEMEMEMDRLKKVAEAEMDRLRKVANDSHYEVLKLKKDAEKLRNQVKDLKEQRFWFAATVLAVIAIYCL